MIQKSNIISRFRPTQVHFELFQNLIQRDLKGKYKRTVLGQLWSLANPLALMLVYSVVFSVLIRMQIPTGQPSGVSSYPLWLLCGLLPWIFTTTVVTQGMSVLIENEGLIRKVYFPRSLLVFASASAISINWLIEMGVLVLGLAIVGSTGVFIFMFPTLLLMAFLFLMATGLALFFSVVNVYFRDTQYLMGVAFQLGMFLTPVLYPISLVQAQSENIGPIFAGLTILDIYQLNPMSGFIECFRSLLYDNSIPNLTTVLFVFLASLIVFIFGYLFFKSHEKKFAEIL